MIELLDLPLECVEIIISNLDVPSLRQASQTCKSLFSIAAPILFQHVVLDPVLTAPISLSDYSLACINSLQIVIPPKPSILDMLLPHFLGTNFFIPAKLPNLQQVSITGNAVRELAAQIAEFPRPIDLCLYNIDLLYLVHLLDTLPPAVSKQISRLSIFASSSDQQLSSIDFARLAAKLPELSGLRHFDLTFNPAFDLCDDLALEHHIAEVFASLSASGVRAIEVHNFPPYLRFCPNRLPPTTESFTFAANEVDAETTFLEELLTQCPAARQLTQLSLAINHSIDDEPFYAGNLSLAMQLTKGRALRLENLVSLRLQIPSQDQVLQALVPVNPNLQFIVVHDPLPAVFLSNLVDPRALECPGNLSSSRFEQQQFFRVCEDTESDDDDSITSPTTPSSYNDDVVALSFASVSKTLAWLQPYMSLF